jgi:hypothetical protein
VVELTAGQEGSGADNHRPNTRFLQEPAPPEALAAIGEALAALLWASIRLLAHAILQEACCGDAG